MAPSAAPNPATPSAPSTSKRTTSSTSDRPDRQRVEDLEVKPYVIVSDLGKGSFATVYRGYHEQTHHQVAIKTVNRSGLSPKLFDNLQGEIEILKSLSHRHITRLLDVIRAERNIYLIMEFCAGGDLANYIKKRGRVEGLEYIPSPGAAPTYYPHPKSGGLDEIVVRSFLRQLARAIKFLRQRNLIHRDIKPQNLLLNPAGPDEYSRGHPLGVPVLKVADFGFARFLPQAMMAETLCGSPLYMAPEILSYQKYDSKADLWSVGAVLYEMAVGKPPFRAQNHIELLKKIDNSKGIKFPDEDPQMLARAQAKGEEIKPVPSDIKMLIRSLLKRIPAERSSFEEFFTSTAMVKSKFPRPREPTPPPPEDDEFSDQIPDHHRIIPPEVLDPKAMIPPAKIKFKRRTSTGQEVMVQDFPPERIAGPSRSPPGPSPQFSPVVKSKPLSPDTSLIPGETEEDGALRREYVLVGDRQAVEINRAVDEITSRRRPLRDTRKPSQLADDALESPTIESPSPTNANTTFPPPPNTNIPSLSSSPSSASPRGNNPLTRALSIATGILRGGRRRSSTYQAEWTPSSPRRMQTFGGARGQGLGLELQGARDAEEDELLTSLEELAQKTEVLTHWADEMYDYVKAFPQKPLPDPTKFSRREGEPERLAARRKNADIQAEYNAMTCVALYMLLMSFSQKGINKLRNFNEHLQMRDPEGELEVSEGFDEALSWFKDHFIKCHDRAALVKTWLPAQYTGPPTFLDQLVYDRALQLSRIAAKKELFDQANSPDECEKLYEESLWCLYALRDDLLQTDNPFLDEDRSTISTWIKRTKLRLVRCRARMNMTDRERVKDARLDNNLVDVPRIPAPWDEVPPADLHTGQDQITHS
ncbi:kinase-like protein [Lentinus tigrinus ALCF2SS1-7]|uniref:non-specific serine/threonine protein kinase n=1 Tax=Lentinus tigrinus ALCF2SS1-6 TaxID=1328759 RepID=A0A5C2SD56_9APHY|nr:kinase-like protein [Lentinus tigrinus ALCF2SS1-6]RPD76026.1 kinase-like protein [Lentinus tigrinus ALCF2SS1-7]